MTPETSPLYAAEDAAEVVRAIRVATLGITEMSPRTFDAGSATGFLEEWSNWISEDLANLHAPHLIRVFLAAAGEDLQTICGDDEAYGTRLLTEKGQPLLERSLTGGTHVLEALPGARHLGLLRKLQKAVEKGTLPAHFATAFACQSQFFNVTLSHALIGFAFLEWQGGGGRSRTGKGGSETTGETFARDACDGRLLHTVRKTLTHELRDRSPFSACA